MMMHNLDPLLLESWIEFNCEMWGLSSHKVELGPTKGTSWELQTVIYSNSRNELVMPPRNPYLPVSFKSSNDTPYAVNSRKRQATEALLQEYLNFKMITSISLSPVLNDVRPFIWSGMQVEPRYTYYLSLDNYKEHAKSGVLRKARKAANLGYTCEISTDYEAIYDCLKGPEQRNNFDHRTKNEDLQMVSDYVGDNFICFLARDPEGKPAGAWIRLYTNEGMVLGWSAGVKTYALKDGVNNLLGQFSLDYFSSINCKLFDFVGANIPSVANMKEAWGGELVTYYTIRPQSLRNQLIYNYKFAKHILKTRNIMKS